MIVALQPSSLKGSILAPRSKSDMQRACAAALLHKGTTHIHHPGRSNDDCAAMDVIQKLGARLFDEGNLIRIESHGVAPTSDQIHCGESGLGIRMFTPIAATSNRRLLISGTGSLVTRPMNFFDDILPQVGVRIQSQDGRLPLDIHGPLTPANIQVDGSLSSQFLTGLLFAYSASGANDRYIDVIDLKSKPYIDLTLQVMKKFGMKVPHVDRYERFYFDKLPVDPPPSCIDYNIEGDWSGAAFLFVAGALAGPIHIQGMQSDSVQADKKILEAIRDAGAIVSIENDGYTVAPAALQAFEFDATECPDLFPPLVALAACCKGITRIIGAERLTHKESNRALTLQEEFGKMGIQIELNGDVMNVIGASSIRAAELYSHHDHRIAMACAVAALRAEGQCTITGAEAIGKSYPDFYQHLQQLGATIVQTN
ncbi:MAG: 3-phosphoshikimate 1-carboxyvinyltransferase [Chitinophagaceae bacterium]|jgi:3-phosphoshikimate 1-carboxyvinyltransferase